MATQSDLYSLARAQGLTPERAKIAAAIGMAESGGNPSAHNTDASTGDNSYGLWQINMLGGMGPERRLLFGISSNDELFKPEVNARAMKVLSARGADFTPWTTYTTSDPDKSYKRFINNPVTDHSGDPGWLDKVLKITSPAYAIGTGDNPISETTQALGSAVSTMNKAARWMSNSENWLRVVYVVGGAYLTLAGLQMIVLGGSPLKTIASVVPAGKAAKVAKSVL